jgi:DNA-directed RNA polymerase specialized sigma24 family protein
VQTRDRMATPESSSIADPESRAAQLQVRQLLEEAIAGLPEDYRTIIIMRASLRPRGAGRV